MNIQTLNYYNPFNWTGSKQIKNKFEKDTVSLAFCANESKLSIDEIERRIADKKEQLAKFLEFKKLLQDDASKEDIACKMKLFELDKAIKKANSYIANMEVMLNKTKINPESAFIYNPELTYAKRKEIAEKSDRIFPVNQAKAFIGDNVNSAMIFQWIRDDYLTSDVLESKKYIDVEFPKNKEFIEKIKQHLDTSVSAIGFQVKYNFALVDVMDCIQKGEIIPLYSSSRLTGGNSLIDIANPVNKKTLDEHHKFHPFKSEKYGPLEDENNMVPARYLSSLGYGSVKQIMQLIKLGELSGKIKIIDTDKGKKYSIKVNISNPSARLKLETLRKQNDKCLTIAEFQKRASVLPKRMNEAILNGEVEIIPEFLFFSDAKTYINLDNEKNSKFLHKALFEKEFLSEQVKQQCKDDSSLRMKLAWHFAPKTKAIMSQKAAMNGYASSIIAKKRNGDEVSIKEEKVYRKYLGSCWDLAGSDEIEQSYKTASEILKIYREQGIDAIKDEEVRKIIEEAMN